MCHNNAKQKLVVFLFIMATHQIKYNIVHVPCQNRSTRLPLPFIDEQQQKNTTTTTTIIVPCGEGAPNGAIRYHTNTFQEHAIAKTGMSVGGGAWLVVTTLSN